MNDKMIDPLNVPHEIYDFPNGGIIPAVMNYTLAHAPRPNPPLALAGAISIAAHLMARRYVSEDGTAPNVYIIGLADSGCGKDFPRKVNSQIAIECGMVGTVCDSFASGGGLEDSVLINARVLSQYDEFDTLFRAMKKDSSGSTEAMSAVMLSLYGAANSSHNRRQLSRAGVKTDVPQYCIFPHLSIYGTAIPSQFFNSMSDRMMTNGLFARCLLVPAGGRPGMNTRRYQPMSAELVDYIRSFAGTAIDPVTGKPIAPKQDSDSKPGRIIVPFADDAAEMITASGIDYDSQWEDTTSEAERALLARAQEKVIKLATIFAVSENWIEPVITTAHVLKARSLVNFSNAKSLYLASIYCAENDFHELQQRAIRMIREAGGEMARTEMLRNLHIPVSEFNELITSLEESGEIKSIAIAGGLRRTSTRVKYSLA